MYPTIEEIKENFDGYRLVPVFYEILSDTVTPIRIYKALSENEENAFILESVDNKEKWGRYSFIGVNPKLEVKITNHMAEVISKDDTVNEIIDNPVQFLSKIMEEYKTPRLKNKPNLTGGLVGYFGYDTVRYMEKKLVNVPEDDLKMPDCDLFMYDELVAFDHLSNKIIVIINIDMQDDIERQYYDAEERAKNIIAKIENYSPKATEKELPDTDYKVKSNVTKEEYMANVEKAKDYIVNGDIFQVVLSQRFEIDNPPESFDVYRMLRATNPSPYLYFFKNKKYEIAGASPEMLVNVTDRIVTTKPIAGTIGRGVTEEEDKAFERQLNSDPKERAEHTMLVDLGRNDVGKVSKFGSVEVTSFMQTERYSKVMHLVSDVQGTLRDDKNAIDALLAVLPAGTLSGAPKVRAMEIIDEMENKKRGLYGGTVGYLGFDGNIDTCIAIRTVLFRNNKAYVQAGAGIVADSVPEKEFVETQNKALAVINAIREAGTL
jgi:anthranilate synthase component 1